MIDSLNHAREVATEALGDLESVVDALKIAIEAIPTSSTLEALADDAVKNALREAVWGTDNIRDIVRDRRLKSTDRRIGRMYDALIEADNQRVYLENGDFSE